VFIYLGIYVHIYATHIELCTSVSVVVIGEC